MRIIIYLKANTKHPEPKHQLSNQKTKEMVSILYESGKQVASMKPLLPFFNEHYLSLFYALHSALYH